MKVVEIFDSFQGEGRWVGWPMTFIRLAGCPVECPFCDTDYSDGTNMSAHEIARKVGPTPLHVCVTGGEPLIHRGFSSLVNALLENTWHRTIHIETSGCIEFPKSLLDRRRGRLWITVSPKGKWCGAKMDFIPDVLRHADEVKWIIPGTPLDILDTYATPSHYLQPRNDKITINPVSLRQTLEFAEQRHMPISIQLHKLVGWR